MKSSIFPTGALKSLKLKKFWLNTMDQIAAGNTTQRVLSKKSRYYQTSMRSWRQPKKTVLQFAIIVVKNSLRIHGTSSS